MSPRDMLIILILSALAAGCFWLAAACILI